MISQNVNFVNRGLHETSLYLKPKELTLRGELKFPSSLLVYQCVIDNTPTRPKSLSGT